MAIVENVIDVRGLRKVYGSTVAVDCVDLQVHRGEVFALLGPNGAGKTTTVEMLVGVRRRTSGSVTVLGEDPNRDARGWRARLGVVPQNTGEYLDLSVREVVAHFASFYPHPFAVDEIIERVGLSAKAKASSVSLSGGQKRRLDVAVGVVGRPELVFLDEPTTGLDPVARREAWDLVRYFRDEQVTTVLTTHYLDEAEELSDRAGIIAAGRMRRIGTVAELGDQAGGGTVVSFRRIGDVRGIVPAELATLDDGDGTVTALRTHHPTEVLALVIAWAREQGRAELPDLKVHRPSLEDTYLALLHADETAPAATAATPEQAPAVPEQQPSAVTSDVSDQQTEHVEVNR
jgi:ABC-2 type transport system ATP-binding protein